MKKITVPFFISHQGCPHSCTFCDQSIISGGTRRLPGQSELLEKITTWRNSADGRPLEAAFFGGSFTALSWADQQQLLEPLQKLRHDGTISAIRISTRPDHIDHGLLVRLKHLGVSTIEIGVQSMDNTVLTAAERGHSADDTVKALACIKAHDMAAGAQLMPGLPGDTLPLSRRSLYQAIDCGADFLRIYPAVVLEGTELACQYRNGTYKPLSLDEGIRWCKVLLHDALRAGIPVIRIGLQADEGLNRQTIVAGCWHPALGQLVYSALYGDLIQTLLGTLDSNGQCRIYCHPSRLSDCIGHNREHLQRFAGRVTSVSADESLERHDIRIETAGQSHTGNIITDLNYQEEGEIYA